MTLSFKHEEITKIEDEYRKLEITPGARARIAASAQIYINSLPLSEMAIKGFMYFAMKDYQIQNRINLAETLDLPFEKKKEIALGVAELLKQRLANLLRDPDQEPVLDRVIKESVELSLKHLR